MITEETLQPGQPRVKLSFDPCQTRPVSQTAQSLPHESEPSLPLTWHLTGGRKLIFQVPSDKSRVSGREGSHPTRRPGVSSWATHSAQVRRKSRVRDRTSSAARGERCPAREIIFRQPLVGRRGSDVLSCTSFGTHTHTALLFFCFSFFPPLFGGVIQRTHSIFACTLRQPPCNALYRLVSRKVTASGPGRVFDLRQGNGTSSKYFLEAVVVKNSWQPQNGMSPGKWKQGLKPVVQFLVVSF